MLKDGHAGDASNATCHDWARGNQVHVVFHFTRFVREQICISEGFVHALSIGTHTLRCLAEYGADESGCDYVLHGVSGGAIIYYDDPVLPSGQYQRCYVYATISGIRKRSP